MEPALSFSSYLYLFFSSSVDVVSSKARLWLDEKSQICVDDEGDTGFLTSEEKKYYHPQHDHEIPVSNVVLSFA